MTLALAIVGALTGTASLVLKYMTHRLRKRNQEIARQYYVGE
jgi:hypothetical protein